VIRLIALLAALSMLTGCLDLEPKSRCYHGQQYTVWSVMDEPKGVTSDVDIDGKPITCNGWKERP
jgi:hypothetical protein